MARDPFSGYLLYDDHDGNASMACTIVFPAFLRYEDDDSSSVADGDPPAGMQDRSGRPRAGRGRSRSPTMIDRYQPDPRPRDDYYANPRDPPPRTRDDRRRPASPPFIDRYVPDQTAQPAVRVNALTNPLAMDYQVGFNYFAEWWRGEQLVKEDKERLKDGGRRPPPRAIKGDREVREDREKERAKIQEAYDAYKEELQMKMAKLFVSQHKDEDWFKERYLPESSTPIRQNLNEFRREGLTQWEKDIESGIFDEFSLEGIYKAEHNGMGGVVEREEGETVAAAELLSVADLVPSKGGDIRDESAQQPALLIKTLATHVGRAKIEDLCKEHLGEGEGGYKWLSLSDPNPTKKFHRIGWIMLHPGSEQVTIATAERGDGRDEDDEEGVDGMEVETKPLSTAEKALEAINGKTIEDEARGNFTCHVGVHVPAREPRKKALWDLYSAPERIERDLELAKRLVNKFDQELGPSANGIAKVEERVEDLRSKGTLQSSVGAATNGEKIKAEDEDMEDGEEGEEDGLIDEDNDSEELLTQKKTLDLLVEYLRRVYNFCFFCVFESDSVHELIRKCPGGHLRRPRASLSTSAKKAAKASAFGEPFPFKRKEGGPAEEGDENGASPVVEKFTNKGNFKTDQQLLRAFNWVKTFEEKIMRILEPENADVRKLGGKPIEEALNEDLKKFVKQEDENKFRCKVPECTKLFKGEVFWRKHVEKRHVEWFEEIKKSVCSHPVTKSANAVADDSQLSLVNTYVLDPSHIAPSRSDANSNGHFPMPNNVNAAGTPRGFNLQGMSGMMPGFAPNMQAGGAFPSFPNFGNHTVQPPMYAMNNGMAINGDETHQAGPMRRGGGRFGSNARPGGPYDRRQQPRFNGVAGPMMGNPMAMGRGPRGGDMVTAPGGRWGDGGAQTVGPKEAVQGRTLKKYDDLDAVEGGAGGELNY